MGDLIELASRVEASPLMLRDRTLNREVARAVGWGYRKPGEMGRKNPGWFHPEDCRNGVPILDSLHGTDVWREPLDYLGSLDAALTLLKPLPWLHPIIHFADRTVRLVNGIGLGISGEDFCSRGETMPRALTAASLRALARNRVPA